MTGSREPWWRRRRGAVETVLALLVVPAVLALALLVGRVLGDTAAPAAPSPPAPASDRAPSTASSPGGP